MAKKVIALKPNQLLTVAAACGACSISALHEATGVDKKDLDHNQSGTIRQNVNFEKDR